MTASFNETFDDRQIVSFTIIIILTKYQRLQIELLKIKWWYYRKLWHYISFNDYFLAQISLFAYSWPIVQKNVQSKIWKCKRQLIWISRLARNQADFWFQVVNIKEKITHTQKQLMTFHIMRSKQSFKTNAPPAFFEFCYFIMH